MLLSILMTGIAYCVIPLILVLTTKKTIGVWRYRRICIAITVGVWLVFRVLETFLMDGSGSRVSPILPAVIWCCVSNVGGQMILEKRGRLYDPRDEKDEDKPGD